MSAWKLVATLPLLLACAARPASGPKTITATQRRVEPAGSAKTTPDPDALRARRWLLWGTPQRNEARGLLLPSSSLEPLRFPGLSQGTWSPDGSLFASCSADVLRTLRAGSEGLIALEPSSLSCVNAYWAPSGRGLLVRRDGSRFAWLADASAPAAIAEFATHGLFAGTRPDWAATGAHVLLQAPLRTLDVVSLPAVGEPVSLLPAPSEERGPWHGCAWSPVGSKLACVVRSFRKGPRGMRVSDGVKIIVHDADQPNDPAIEVAHLLNTGALHQLAWVGTKWLAFGLPPRVNSSSAPRNPWGSLHAVRVAPGSTPVLVEDSTFVWAAAPGSESTLAYAGDCRAHGVCVVELDDAGPTQPRLVARGHDFRSLTWSKQGGRLLIRAYDSLRLLENASDRRATAILVARAPAEMNVDGDFAPDAQWLEVMTTRRKYLVSQPGSAARPEPGRSRPSFALWHIAKRALIPLEFPGESLPWKRFWAPDDTSFAFLISHERSYELSLLEIRDGKPLAPRRLGEGRDLYDAWVAWQPKSQPE